MNVEYLKKNYPLLLEHVKNNGYSAGYISKYLKCVNQVIENSSIFDTFEDLYNSMIGRYSKPTLMEKRIMLHRIEEFTNGGKCFDRNYHQSPQGSDKVMFLSSYYKELIDRFYNYLTNNGYSPMYINQLYKYASRLFYHLQKHGCIKLSDAKEATIHHFFKEYKGSYDVVSKLRIIISKIGEYDKTENFASLISYFPQYRNIRKVYPFLKDDELSRINYTLNNSTNISLRDKAIVTLMLHTGLRSSDIANLKFEI